ncbi:MAG: response regulator [Thermodesulfobacteriota bacterium]
MREGTILLVEDNPNDEELTLLALNENHITNPVIVVRDGAAALDWLFARGAHVGRDARDIPLLILLDLKLPKVDGLEVLRLLRADDRTRLTPVVIMTSSQEEEDRLKSYSLGANSYIRKPVDFTHFVETVRNLGMYWLVLNEPPPRFRGPV